MRSTQFLDNLNGAVRENPVAAGLIGMGLVWIVLGKSGAAIRDASGLTRSAKRTIDTTVNAATGAVSGALEKAIKAASGMSDALSQSVEAAGSKIGEAVEGLKTSSPEPETRSEFARHFPSPSSNRLADLLSRQPLALAVVGVGVGAAIASAFPSSGAETRLMGAAGEKLKETMADATSTFADKAASVIQEATDEAVAQNLTPEALKEAARAGAARLKTVVDAGLEALKK
jgi:hypothetical protein